jgi:uncharacterized membrane protein
LVIAPDDRQYRLLLPPSPQTGPVCVALNSATAEPQETDRVVGVGVRELSLRSMAAFVPPPPAQLAINLWLALGGYWLLRRLGAKTRIATLLAVGGLSLIAFGVSGGWLRVTANLPYWSRFAASAIGLLLAADLVYARFATVRAWQRELLGVALTAAILTISWAAMAALEGYFWPFPLMARAGTAFSWNVLLPVGIFAVYLAVLLWMLRQESEFRIQKPADSDYPRPPVAEASASSAPSAPSAVHKLRWWPLSVIVVCWLGAVLLAVTLKTSLQGWPSLFQTFAEHGSDYINDVPRIGSDPLGFLRQYVELMPELARHNRNHPPGSVLFLWGIAQVFGPGPGPATWVAIAIAALGVWPSYRLANRVAGPQAGLIAAGLYGLLPAQIAYGATSMDAAYATVLAFAADALHRAITMAAPEVRSQDSEVRSQKSEVRSSESASQHGSRSTDHGSQLGTGVAAFSAGCWVALSFMFTWGTAMLALFAGALVLALLWQQWRVWLAPLLVRSVLICGTVLALLALVYLVTGYDSLAGFVQGTRNNYDTVQQQLPPSGPATYLFFLAANALAYAWFLGPWPVFRLASAGRAALHTVIGRSADAAALLVAAYVVMVLGMLASGLFTREVERIWTFSHILVASSLASGMIQGHTRRQTATLFALMLCALFAHSLIFRATLRIAW